MFADSDNVSGVLTGLIGEIGLAPLPFSRGERNKSGEDPSPLPLRERPGVRGVSFQDVPPAMTTPGGRRHDMMTEEKIASKS